MANPTQYLKQIAKDLKMKAGGVASDVMEGYRTPSGVMPTDPAAMRAGAMAGNAVTAAGNAVGTTSDKITKAVGTTPVPALITGAGAVGTAGGLVTGANMGAAGAQADMAAQLDAEQQQKFAMAAQEMGKMAVYDPATGTASITPQSIKKSLEKINGQGSAEGLTAQDYQEIAAMTGLQLDMSGVA